MFRYFFMSKKWALWAYGGGAVLIFGIWLQVNLSVAINDWYGDFYNLLQTATDYKDKPGEGISIFYQKLIGLDYIWHLFGESAQQVAALEGAGEETVTEVRPSFAVIAFPYVFIALLANWFTRIYGLRWRQAMTFGFIPRWRNVEEEIEGASQRIQEDCNRFARIVESLGLQVVRAVMTLMAFIPILWGLSSKVEISWIKEYEGSLVWIALMVSIGGLAISWFVGAKLPGLEYNNQRVEAAFRKELVYGEDDKRNYAKPENLIELFLGIRFNYHRLYLHYGYFDLWIGVYDQFMTIVPYLIMGPSLFHGVITLGVLVQVSNAFSRVHNGFALFLHNWTTITELRSIHKRLKEFEVNLKQYEDKNIPMEKYAD